MAVAQCNPSSTEALADDPTSLRFTASTPLYAFAPDATPMAMYDQLTTRLSQLKAMLVLAQSTNQDGMPALGEIADDLQQSYLWACQQMTEECMALASGFDAAKRSGGAK